VKDCVGDCGLDHVRYRPIAWVADLTEGFYHPVILL
jgi:hypothetical protein